MMKARATSLAAAIIVCWSAPSWSAVVLSEGFEGGIPGTWSVIDNSTDCTPNPCAWTTADPGSRGNLTGGTGLFATADSDAGGSAAKANTELRTPAMDLSGGTSATLSFRYDYNDLGSADSGTLDVSTDGGTTWANLQTWSTDDRGPKLFQTAALPTDPSVMIRWHYVAGWDWWWQVDDVLVTTAVDGGSVPEPGTLALLSASLLAFGLARRRR